MYINRPVGQTTYAAPQAPTGGNAPQPVTVAVNNYQGPPAAAPAVMPASGGGIMAMIGNLLSGLVGFVKNAFAKIFGAGAPATQPTPTAPTQPGTTTGGPDDATLAQQFGLQNTPQNVAAFKATLAAQQAEPNVLGPGVANPEACAELQQLLAGWGFPVQATGQFDANTADAVMKFKAANGLTENFAFANGQPGVTPFVDNRTREKMLALLTGPAQPGTTTTPAPTTPTTPAQPTGDAAAIAAQFRLAPDAANVAAYQAAAAELVGKGAFGPGNAPADAVSELQTLLGSWGFPVQANGQFDQATIDALLSFKAQNGLTDARFKMADGSAGVTAFVDEATQAVMLKKLEAGTAQPAPAPAPVPAPAPAPAPAPTTQYQASALSAEEQQIAQEQDILATRENFDAFVKEAQALETQNAIGPGSTNADAVKELQQLLAGWGYAAQQTGQFDQATADAVIKFKRDNGVASSYKLADGTPGVHPFVDEATKAVMMKKLGL